MKLKKLICIGLLGVLCTVSAVGCGKKESIKTTTEVSSEANTKEASAQVFAMDTYMNLKAYGKNAQKAVDDAKSEIERLDQLWSAVDKNSEIYQLNQKKKMKVSDETLELIDLLKRNQHNQEMPLIFRSILSLSYGDFQHRNIVYHLTVRFKVC